MVHYIFLLTGDELQRARVGAAAERLAAECRVTAGAVPPEAGQYELWLLDDRLWECLPPPAAPPHPRIILLASGASPLPEAMQPGVVDVIPRTASKAQIQLVLRQQLGILKLLRLRGRLDQDAGAPLPSRAAAEINNPLTGILGHAELALASRSRMPAEVRQRLESVRQLAGEIREVLAAQRRAA
jgi:signal transduction histidine kinase